MVRASGCIPEGSGFESQSGHFSTLTFFKTQGSLSPRQSRWSEYLSCFDFEIVYVKGDTNTVADSFSRFFTSAVTGVPSCHYVNADCRLDPEGEDLPILRAIEIWSSLEPCPTIDSLILPSTHDASVRAIRRREINADTVIGSHASGEDLMQLIGDSLDLRITCKDAYQFDAVLRHIIDAPESHDNFRVREGMVQMRNTFN